MKNLFLLAAILFLSLPVGAQLTTGMFIYTRSVDFQRDITPEMKASMGNMPAKFESSLELMFDKGQALYRPAPDLEGMESGGGGMMRRMMAGEEVYTDFTSRICTTRYEVGDQVYIVIDTIKQQGWKLTNETKDIMGYTCRKALTTKIVTNRRPVVENGQQVRKEVTDTVDVEAWYAEAIPVPAGPDFSGTLPGLILEMTMAEGRIHIVATDFRKKYPKPELKRPEGTLVSRDELKAKQKEFFKSMGPRGGGH